MCTRGEFSIFVVSRREQSGRAEEEEDTKAERSRAGRMCRREITGEAIKIVSEL